MTPDKNNFCFHNDGSDDAKNACVMMYENQNAGRVVGGYYGKLKGVNFCDLELNDLRPSLVTPAEAIKLMQGDDLKDYYVAEAQATKWEPKVGEECQSENGLRLIVRAIYNKLAWVEASNPDDILTVYLSELRPIAKPVMKEPRELYSKILESVGHASVCCDENKVFDEKEATKCADSLLEFFMDWHNRNTLEPLEVTDEEIRQVFCKDVHFTGLAIKECISTVRHFLKLQQESK